jgi:predicted RNase H-like nuclease (RuvC/YqgF family)
MRLYRPPAGTEDNTGASNALVPIVVRANGRAELIVDERAANQQHADWLSDLAEEAVTGFLKDDRADRTKQESVKLAWIIRQQWKRLDDEQSILSRERAELERTQQELRSNLEAIRKNDQAADLRRKLTKKLDESTTRFDKVQKRLVELSVATREQQIRFEDAIRELTITSAPPPQD